MNVDTSNAAEISRTSKETETNLGSPPNVVIYYGKHSHFSKITNSRFIYLFTFLVSRCSQPSAGSRRSILSPIRAIHQARHHLHRFHCVFAHWLVFEGLDGWRSRRISGSPERLHCIQRSYLKILPRCPAFSAKMRRETVSRRVDKTLLVLVCWVRYSPPRATSSGSPPHLRHQISSPSPAKSVRLRSWSRPPSGVTVTAVTITTPTTSDSIFLRKRPRIGNHHHPA